MGILSSPDVHTLDGNADAVEFCPLSGFHHTLAAATYTLQEEAEEPSRVGKLYLFQVAPRSASHVAGNGPACQAPVAVDPPKMVRVHEVNTAGIFDIKWCWTPVGGRPCLGQAGADGKVTLHALREDGAGLSEMGNVECCTDAMCLSLDWQPGGGSAAVTENSSEEVDAVPVSQQGLQIAVSQSDGAISTVQLAPQGPLLHQTWAAHSFEAWITSFDRLSPQVLYSGGDDCNFCAWDTRCDNLMPIFRDKRSHSMGVCSIASNPYKEHALVTGSYDENVRVWDTRMVGTAGGKALAKAQLGTGGGVWRLRWHPHDPDLLLAALMHRGFGVLRVHGQEDVDITMLETYDGHTSLGYGADWFHGILDEGTHRKDCESALSGSVRREDGLLSLVATCSFYDRLLHLWNLRTFAS